MSNMQYGRAVSGKSTSLNVNLSGTRIASYNPQSSRSSSGSGSTFTSTTSTIDLSAFLTDNIDETIAKERIKNSKHYDSYQSGWDKVQDVIDKVGATCVVAYTSVVSGFIDVGEAVLDGSVWLTSKVVGLVSDDAETAMKEFIAKDLVSEANEWFYEQTDVGRAINDASALKYDSELAQGVRSVAEDVTVFVAATALSVVTCGAATPLVVMGVGALYGMGAAAQDTYAAHGTDTTTWQELMILGNGALSALSWYTSGKLGKGFIELGKSMAEAGVKEILAEMCRGIFSKETLKELFKPGNIVGNAIASLMQTGGDIGLIATKLYNGGEVTPEEWALLIGELIVYFGLNTAEDVLSDTIISYGNPKIDVDMNKTPDAPDAPDTPKTPDTQDTPISPTTMEGNGLEDAVPKQPSADTPPQKQIETLDETEIIPEAKTPHPDDPYIDKALDILDPNTTTKLGDEIGNLDDNGLQKVLTVMTNAEIAAQLKYLDTKDMDRVLSLLSKDELKSIAKVLKESGEWKVDPVLFYKYPEVFNNPKYTDFHTGEQIWPPAEGAQQYISQGWSNADLVRVGTTQGVDALKNAGATELTIGDLQESGSITRIANKKTIKDDGYGEFFGSSSTDGMNDISHRVLGPSTTEYGQTFRYEISESADISLAEKQLGTLNMTDLFNPDGTPYTDGELHIRILQTNAADWFDQTGGADQISFYLTDGNGNIMIKNNPHTKGDQLFKLTRDQLASLGIIEKVW